MGRIVFITQSYLPENTILGVTQDWVRALAARSDGVDVVALSARSGTEDAGRIRVFSLGKEQGAGRPAQLVAFYRALAATARDASAYFIHMVPRYALLALPAARLTRRPLALWYAQGGVSRPLRAAVRVVDHIYTPTRDSFPLRGGAVDARLRVTGHGVDTARYAPGADPESSPKRIFAAGRLSPAKRYEALIAALPHLSHQDWQVRIASGSLYAASESYEGRLRAQVQRLGLTGRVSFLGGVPYTAMPEEYRAAWVLGHTSGTGSLDKVVLEAMACGTPVVSSAPSSRAVLHGVDAALCVSDSSEAAVGAGLDRVLGWSMEQRRQTGLALRAVVEREHNLAGWADRVTALLGG